MKVFLCRDPPKGSTFWILPGSGIPDEKNPFDTLKTLYIGIIFHNRSMPVYKPRGSIYTTIMELGAPNHNGDGLLGPNSIIVVYMDPLGKQGSVRFVS